MSPRPPPKISLRHDWTNVGEVPFWVDIDLGSTVDQQPEGKDLFDSHEEKFLRRKVVRTRNILPTNPTNPKTNL